MKIKKFNEHFNKFYTIIPENVYVKGRMEFERQLEIINEKEKDKIKKKFKNLKLETLDDELFISEKDGHNIEVIYCVAFKTTDEWYYIRSSYSIFHFNTKPINVSEFVKCDQLEGLIEYIKDIRERVFLF